MGAQIAAHMANAGIPTLLLDLTADVARDGLSRARAARPDPFFTAEVAPQIQTGGFGTDLHRLADIDLVIEAVIEQLDVKRSLLERVDAVRGAMTIVSSNTSGIRLGTLAEGRSNGFRRHWLGTHFFNPPRYMHLLEIIPTPETDPSVVVRVSHLADMRLGKGVVIAKDSPNFIANHIGLFSIVHILKALESGDYTIDEIDAITGPALGRPKSATFRTMDIAGLDVICHVVANLQMPVPALLQALVERGWIGEKAGQGFYKRTGSDILVLDPASFTYRPRQSVRIAALEAVRNVDDAAVRTKTLFLDPGRVGRFLQATLAPVLVHTARVAPDIAYSIDDVDRAMRWGFAWEIGPFEIWDAIGVREVLDAVQTATSAVDVPPAVQAILDSGGNRFRTSGLPPAAFDLQILKASRDREMTVRRNAGASLVDLGDGVLAVEFHSKMNTIGGDTVEMLQVAVKEAGQNFGALVVGNDAPNFSAGANLMLVLLDAQDGNWDEIDQMIRAFQDANRMLRYGGVPVIVAPAGLTLGGGCEIMLHADRVQAAAESYIGLVEAGVGLIPAGGGVTEMLARSGLNPAALQHAFETIGFAKVSTSASGARDLGLLGDADRITMNRERLMSDAKALAVERAREGHRQPAPRTIAVGGDGALAAFKLGIHLAWRAGRISEHDAVVGRALALVMSGGALPHAATVGEDHILDLEREAFLKLCGERKTLERIQYTLKTGKTLRN